MLTRSFKNPETHTDTSAPVQRNENIDNVTFPSQDIVAITFVLLKHRGHDGVQFSTLSELCVKVSENISFGWNTMATSHISHIVVIGGEWWCSIWFGHSTAHYFSHYFDLSHSGNSWIALSKWENTIYNLIWLFMFVHQLSIVYSTYGLMLLHSIIVIVTVASMHPQTFGQNRKNKKMNSNDMDEATKKYKSTLSVVPFAYSIWCDLLKSIFNFSLCALWHSAIVRNAWPMRAAHTKFIIDCCCNLISFHNK